MVADSIRRRIWRPVKSRVLTDLSGDQLLEGQWPDVSGRVARSSARIHRAGQVSSARSVLPSAGRASWGSGHAICRARWKIGELDRFGFTRAGFGDSVVGVRSEECPYASRQRGAVMGRWRRLLVDLREFYATQVEMYERLDLMNRPWEEEFLHWVDTPRGPELHGHIAPPADGRRHSVTRQGWCLAARAGGSDRY